MFFLNISFSFALEAIDAIERGSKSAVFIIAKFKINNTKESILKMGTGFLIDTEKSPGTLIVTNRHILQHKIKGEIISPHNIIVKISLSSIEPTICNAQIIALHDVYDIGLLYPNPEIKIPKDVKLKVSGKRQYYEWEHRRFLLEKHILDDSKIREGLEIFFSGYSLNLGINKFKNYPITRKGIIAQAIPWEKEFIIDGFASHGNSGSPVYCLNGDSINLLGIQSRSYNDTNRGYDENGIENSLVSFNSGLSIVIKASVIKKFVYDLIDQGKYKGDWSKD